MHDAEIFPAMPQTKEMPHFMQADFGGPLVIEVDRRQTTIGRGMASRILVDMEEEQ